MQRLREYRFPAVLALAIIVAGSIPYCYGYLKPCPDKKFMGLVGRDVPGNNVYLMFEKQAQDGHLLFDNKMTPEDMPAVYLNPELWLLGTASRVTGLSLISMFHIDRILTVAGFMFAAYFLISMCLDTVFQRRFALALLVFGTGFGWIPWLVSQVSRFEYELIFDIDGVNVFGNLVSRPHFACAHTLAILTYALVLVGERSGKRFWFILSGLCAFAHISMRPYAIPETYLFYLLFPTLLCIRERRFRPARFGNYALAGLIPVPAVMYYVYMIYFGPLGAVWNPLDWRPPHFLSYIVWNGLPFLLLFTCFEGFSRLREMRPSTILLVLWIMLSFVLAQSWPYLKGADETAYGLQLVPPILVTVGPLKRIYGALSASRVYARIVPRGLPSATRKRIAAAMFIGFCSLSNIVVYGTMFTRMNGCSHPFYIRADVYESIRWLARNSASGDVVLADKGTGMFIPRLSANKAFTGHFVFTIGFAEKNTLVDRFFGTRDDDGFKRYLVGKYRIRYVLNGPYEKRPDGMVPADHPWLERVYSRGDVSLYKVTALPPA